MANVMTAQHDPLIGMKLGRFQIEALLGRGPSAAVYRAIDSVVGRPVAIKVLDRAAQRDPVTVAAFLRDAETLARLSHPQILAIYEAAERDSLVYIARQYTDGGTLRGLLHEVGTLSVPEALALLRPIATALDYAHRQGFVHGNLRPANILRTTDNQIFLTDFVVPGKERATGSAATTVISAIDAPEYASPEQVRDIWGAPSSDLYVLGIIIYEALTGRPPFQIGQTGENARNVLTRHLQSAPPAPTSLNPLLGPAVEAVLLRALAKRPEDRYATGGALHYAFNEAYEQDSATPRAQPIIVGKERVPAGEAGRTPKTGVPETSPPRAREVAPAPPGVPPRAAAGALAAAAPLAAAPVVAPVAVPAQERQATEAVPVAPLPAKTMVMEREPQSTTIVAGRGTAARPPAAPLPAVSPMTGAVGTRNPRVPAPRRAAPSWIAVIARVLLLAVAVVGGVFFSSRSGTGATGDPGASPVVATPPLAVAAAPAPTVAAATTPPPPPTLGVASTPPTPLVGAAGTPATSPTAPLVAPATLALRRQELILFSSQRGGGAVGGQIYAMDPDGKGVRQVTRQPGTAWGPRIAPDGRSFSLAVAPVGQGERTAVAGGLEGKGKHDLALFNTADATAIALSATATWNSGWSWSPDGKALAFSSNRDGNWELYLLAFPGGAIVRLTTNAAQDAWPAWTPDGKKIVFMSTREGYEQLYIMDADGKNVARLNPSETSDTLPVVSPDGKKVAYVAQESDLSESQVFVMDIDGGNATRLTSAGTYNGQPTWSPDSARLAFVSNREGVKHIYTMRADGSAQVALTSGAGEDATPEWGFLTLAPAALTGELANLPPVIGSTGLASALWTRRRRGERC